MKIFIIVGFLIISLAKANINYPLIDQQTTCMFLGSNLINNCVENDGDLEECSAIYSAYYSCIIQLNAPLQIEYKRDIDNYKNNPFSPCGYEISHLILNNKCY